MGSIISNKIYDISFKILQGIGVPANDAEIIADTILDAHRKGKHTHGVRRITSKNHQ
ncbi:MAG: hypothetical protein LBN34_05995 [Clostridiales Family XIII bacterium]|jgi:LDH2 family malate/lactate/ureidoglycolate dehydrogenase|nr:hypothetical protein [Clostridiales Family XIII bacterium]